MFAALANRPTPPAAPLLEQENAALLQRIARLEAIVEVLSEDQQTATAAELQQFDEQGWAWSATSVLRIAPGGFNAGVGTPGSSGGGGGSGRIASKGKPRGRGAAAGTPGHVGSLLQVWKGRGQAGSPKKESSQRSRTRPEAHVSPCSSGIAPQSPGAFRGEASQTLQGRPPLRKWFPVCERTTAFDCVSNI